jgi:hypothetical protein
MSEVLIVSIINSSAVLLAAIITATGLIMGAGRLSKHIVLKKKLLVAYKDLEAQYTIEKYHSEMNIAVNHVCNKTHVRTLVKEKEGLVLSGEHTLFKVQRKITSIQADLA